MPQITTLRAPRSDEFPALSALCMRSKAHWGYDDRFMEACREELTLDPVAVDIDKIQVVECDAKPAGVALISVNDEFSNLEKLFIEPDYMGVGAGKALFNWSVDQSRKLGAKAMFIESDPQALPFYLKMGAVEVGQVASGSIVGRFLPRLRLDLS